MADANDDHPTTNDTPHGAYINARAVSAGGVAAPAGSNRSTENSIASPTAHTITTTANAATSKCSSVLHG